MATRRKGARRARRGEGTHPVSRTDQRPMAITIALTATTGQRWTAPTRSRTGCDRCAARLTTAPLAIATSRLAVVTGASSGIGAATARALAAAGFHVFCAARRTDRIEKLASDIGGTAVACDVTDETSVAALAEAVGPRLDVLVNNAGGAFGTETVAEARVEDWRAMFDVNVIGTLNVTKALLPALVASGDGVLINMGSTAGRVAYEGGGGYTAAKHGVAVMTETLRLELVGQPVRIC